ncbi:MAG: hypothetical protein D6762_00220 [Candidatus Neomarinimicrobiota bacterium]|nr:MAG: hypothetical protein D6762_00220 [Candidatus Neomarinimicrobiota bacterium]
MEDVINQWVNEELLYQAALQENLDQDQTLARMVEDYRRKLLGKTFLESKIHHIQPVTAQEIKDYYTANRSMFVRNTDEARIYHFILPTIQEAKNVFRLLSAPSSGEERRELFTKYHVDAVTVRKGFLLPELDDVIFHSRSRAKILGPIQSFSGYHVVEILDRYPKGSPKTLNQVYDEIYQRLITERQNLSALKLIDSLRINSHIEVLMENEPHE